MHQPRVRSFYRIATSFPPPDQDYRSASERRGGAPPPKSLPPDLHRSWYEGLSAYDTLDGAVRQAIDSRGRLGMLIVRYDVPEGSGITWQQGRRDPHHYDLYGERDELKRYLAADFMFTVQVADAREDRNRS